MHPLARRIRCAKQADPDQEVSSEFFGPRTRILQNEPREDLPQYVQNERAREVLHQKYVEPAPKQYAEAADLGLTFATYRRALALGVSVVTESLWAREVEAAS